MCVTRLMMRRLTGRPGFGVVLVGSRSGLPPSGGGGRRKRRRSSFALSRRLSFSESEEDDWIKEELKKSSRTAKRGRYDDDVDFGGDGGKHRKVEEEEEEEADDEEVIQVKKTEVDDGEEEFSLPELKPEAVAFVHSLPPPPPSPLTYGGPTMIPKMKSRDKGKMTLVLDVDETLIYCSLTPFQTAPLSDFFFPVGDKLIYVRKRPGLDQFLDFAAE